MSANPVFAAKPASSRVALGRRESCELLTMVFFFSLRLRLMSQP
jgi:hypothetical protein